MRNFLEWMRNPKLRGVIHIGANDGAEYDDYVKFGLEDQIWVEPFPKSYERLLKRLPKSDRIKTYRFACGSENRMMPMFILDDGKGCDHSNSLLQPKLHLDYHPHLPVVGTTDVQVVRFDDLMRSDSISVEGRYNLLVLDTQGYELECLKGAENTVKYMDYIVSEVNKEELYAGCALVGAIDAWLSERGFERKYTDWCGPNESYGDALYCRRHHS